MIRVYIREFIAICDYLERSSCKQTNQYFCVERAVLEELLDRNNYETQLSKLKLWKELRWIDADDKHLTKLMFDGKKGKNVRMFVLRKDVYQALKGLAE